LKPPASFRELLAFLKARPRVAMSCDSPRVPVGGPGQNPETFLRYADGLLWFRNAAGVEHHLPVHCGLPAAGGSESGLAFFPDHFTFTKFNTCIRVTYLEADPS
jgi:hypothetical protein